MYVFIFLLSALKCQFDWTGGSGNFGPVSDWGSKFLQYDSVTINTPRQVSPVASGGINPTGWIKHIIDPDVGGGIYWNSIVAGDFDNDGNIDLAGWKSLPGQLVFYKNNGSDSFIPVDTFAGPSGGYWGFIYAGDLDNDGKTDVVVPSGEAGYGLYWYKNNGGWSFTQETISTESLYIFADGADIDRSGNISIGASRAYKGGVEIWKNSGSGVFGLAQTMPDSGWRVRFVDLNNDGYPDLVVGVGYNAVREVRIYMNDGTGYFSTASMDTFASGSSAFYVNNDALWDGDFNNDGNKDLIVGIMVPPPSYSDYEIWWMQNDGSGTGWTKHLVHGGDLYFADGGCVEDFDFDGKADVASGYYDYLDWFQQVNPDSFVAYPIDVTSSLTHWIVPFKTKNGKCFKSGAVNLLVCWRYSFVWYENNVVSGFSGGSLQSSVLRLQCGSQQVNWGYFGWKTCCPVSSAITFQLRSGIDSANITGKSFSAPIVITPATQIDSVSLASYTSLGDSLFQYQINFTGGSDAGIVDSVWVTYTCLDAGINQNSKPEEFLKVYPGKICYSLAQESKITLSLYNVSGRLVKTLDRGERNKGGHWINVPQILNGAYLAVLNINGRRLTKKMVVIK